MILAARRLGIRLNIFGKLLIGIIAMVMLISLIAIVGINSVNYLGAMSDKLLNESAKQAAIQNLQLSFQQILMPPNDYLIHGNQVEKSNFEQLLNKVEAQMDICRDFSWDNRGLIFMFKFESHLVELKKLASDIFRIDNPKEHPEGSVMMEELDTIADRAIGLMDELMEAEAEEMLEQIQTNQATNIRTRRFLIMLGLLICISLVIGGFFYVRSITGPLKLLIQMAQKVSGGNLYIKAEVNTHDEIEYLANSFNSMIGILEKTTVSREYFSSILNRMVDSLIITDAKGKIKIVNQATLDLLRYQETELVGQHMGRVLTPNGHEDFQSKLDDLINLILKGEENAVYNIYYTKQDIAIPVLFSGSLIYDKDKEISGIICIAYHNDEYGQEEKYNKNVDGNSESRYIRTIGDIPLTKRELEIVKLIAEDKTNHEIARRLFISVRTVETHRRNIMQKLQIRSAISLVYYAVQAGII